VLIVIYVLLALRSWPDGYTQIYIVVGRSLSVSVACHLPVVSGEPVAMTYPYSTGLIALCQSNVSGKIAGVHQGQQCVVNNVFLGVCRQLLGRLKNGFTDTNPKCRQLFNL
jgi:hypothetical protein